MFDLQTPPHFSTNYLIRTNYDEHWIGAYYTGDADASSEGKIVALVNYDKGYQRIYNSCSGVGCIRGILDLLWIGLVLGSMGATGYGIYRGDNEGWGPSEIALTSAFPFLLVVSCIFTRIFGGSKEQCVENSRKRQVEQLIAEATKKVKKDAPLEINKIIERHQQAQKKADHQVAQMIDAMKISGPRIVDQRVTSIGHVHTMHVGEDSTSSRNSGSRPSTPRSNGVVNIGSIGSVGSMNVMGAPQQEEPLSHSLNSVPPPYDSPYNDDLEGGTGYPSSSTQEPGRSDTNKDYYPS